MDDRRPPHLAISRAPAAAAGVVFAAFAVFSVWQVHDGAALDHLARRFTDWVMEGWVDPTVSFFGPLAEPAFATIVAILLAAVLAVLRGWRVAVLTLAGFATLAVAELGLRAVFGRIGGCVSDRDARVYAV